MLLLLLLLVPLLLDIFLTDVNCGFLPEAKRDSEESFLTDAVHELELDPETIEELLSKDRAMLEGDMVLSSDRNAIGRTWPTLEIPYDIHADLYSRTEQITAAMAMISKDTCLSFHKRTIEDDYLLFQTGKGCASYVGFIGGRQPVFIGSRCIVGNIVHEILHALGFQHEHTRMDRENYITIFAENIMSGEEKNFKKHDGKTFSLPYDIQSILHYGRKFFSANGKPTIIAKKYEKQMGQRTKMTWIDYEKVRRLYLCDAFKPPLHKLVSLDDSEESNAAHNQTFDSTGGNQSIASPSASPAWPAVTLQALNSTSRGCDEPEAC